MIVNGTELAVFRQGKGAPVLFHHGSSSDHRTWSGTAKTVSMRFEAITYGRRYHHPNAPIAAGADYSMTEQADDLEALIEALDLGALNFVAHSYDGVLAIIDAARRPELFKSLVLEEPPAFNIFVHDPPRALEVLKLLRKRPRLGRALIGFGAGIAGPAKKAAKAGNFEEANRIFSEGDLGAQAYGRLSAERRRQARENTTPEEILGSGFVKIDSASLANIACPVLLISGQNSPVLWPLIAGEVMSLLANSRHARVEGASHIVHEHNPEAFAKLILEALADPGTRTH